MANQNVVATMTHFFTRHGHTVNSNPDDPNSPLVLDDKGKDYALRLRDEVPLKPNQRIFIFSDAVQWAIDTVQPLADALRQPVRTKPTQDLYDEAVEKFTRNSWDEPDGLDCRLYVWCFRRRPNEPNGLWQFYKDYLYPSIDLENNEVLGQELSSDETYNYNWWTFKTYIYRGRGNGYKNYAATTQQRRTGQKIDTETE